MKRALIGALRGSRPFAVPWTPGPAWKLLARLPVIAKDEGKKLALVNELKDIMKQDRALSRRSCAVAGALERLAVVNRLIDVGGPEPRRTITEHEVAANGRQAEETQ